MAPFLEVTRVSYGYKATRWVINGVSFSVEEGEFWGIVGPNGAGKTTLLKLLDGIIEPQQGEIRLKGRALEEMSRREIAMQVAVLPQEVSFYFNFTSLEVVLQGRAPFLGALRLEGERDVEIARQSMAKTGSLQFADLSVTELSEGEKQRVLVARALTQQPRLFLLDEPTANLDLNYQVEIMDLVKALSQKHRVTVVMASHDINLAAQYCDKLLLLKDGRVFCQGKPEEVLNERILTQVYKCHLLVDTNPLSRSPRITLRSRLNRK